MPKSSDKCGAGYRALTREQFINKISDFYMFQTGVGTNILIMTVMSFVVGLSISGQTFYTFILENLEKFGALKAIGAKSRELIVMILFQARFTALTGYGLGVGLCALVIWFAKLRLPDYAAMITWWNLWLGSSWSLSSPPCPVTWRPQSVERGAIRHLQGLMMTPEDKDNCDQGERADEVVWRGRSQNLRGEGRQPRDLVRRDGVHRGSVGQRKDDAAERSFRDSQAGRGHGDGGRNRYLASKQR